MCRQVFTSSTLLQNCKIGSLDKSLPPSAPEGKTFLFRGRVRLLVSYKASHFKTLIGRERLRDEQE